MKKWFTSAFVIVCLAFTVGITGAWGSTTVFSDNFDSYLIGDPASGGTLPGWDVPNSLNWKGAGGWYVSAGSVDLIGTGTAYGGGTVSSWDLIHGNGLYIDLDGTTNQGGTLAHDLSLQAGKYVLTFDLAGNQRISTPDLVTIHVSVGTFVDQVITRNMTDPFTTYSIPFTLPGASTITFSFANAGGDNQGALLDRVSVSAVPIPGAIWLLGSGLVALIGARRKCRA